MVGQEKNETNRIKQAPIQSPGQIVQPNSGKKNVTPMIVDASQHGDHVEVRVFVPNVTESTGSCTLTFNNGGASFTKTASSSPDAASTHCAGVTIPLNEFMPKGTWSVAVEYRSPGAEGRSNAKTFTVQ